MWLAAVLQRAVHFRTVHICAKPSDVRIAFSGRSLQFEFLIRCENFRCSGGVFQPQNALYSFPDPMFSDQRHIDRSIVLKFSYQICGAHSRMARPERTFSWTSSCRRRRPVRVGRMSLSDERIAWDAKRIRDLSRCETLCNPKI